jgi:hypothetical protein
MPTLSVQLGELKESGPVIEVIIAPVKPRKRGGCHPLSVRALMDTGSSTTVIKEALAQELGLAAVSVCAVHTASSANVICGEYDLRLMLRNDMVFDVRALGLPMDGQSFGCLIGRDLLAQCTMIYLGQQNQIVLST